MPPPPHHHHHHQNKKFAELWPVAICYLHGIIRSSIFKGIFPRINSLFVYIYATAGHQTPLDFPWNVAWPSHSLTLISNHFVFIREALTALRWVANCPSTTDSHNVSNRDRRTPQRHAGAGDITLPTESYLSRCGVNSGGGSRSSLRVRLRHAHSPSNTTHSEIYLQIK